jgi:LmbE family N-acetylglucosaminyl deacetylase
MPSAAPVSAVIDDKRRAIRAYRSQCAVMRLDDAFVGLARYRGEMHSWPGGAYAEVFASG